MLKITEEYIKSIAPNENAIYNGRELVRKNSFVGLNISGCETVLFGECKGSGASNYITSVDFLNFESPVFSCTCPSRQFPCKHVLGLMYAYIEGEQFQTGDIPQDIIEKRGKAAKKEEKKREEKKKEQSQKKVSGEPKKVNNALLKKMQAQKEGLELLAKITDNIVGTGLGTINGETIKMLEDQAMQLGNYYIPGAQMALREFIEVFKNCNDYEKVYTQAVDHLISLYWFCKKGWEYLEHRINNPEESHDTGSNLDELLGHAWQLSELQDLGFVQKDTELVQLSFNSYTDEARREFVDTGTWINLKTGQVLETRNYRPFKAANKIREDDSVCSVICLKELFVYPGGDMNPRVRWEEMTARELDNSDYTLIKSYAGKSIKEIVKSVKNQIKNPLSSKYPAAILSFARIGTIGDSYVLEDGEGERIVLSDIPVGGFEPPSVELLALLDRESLHDQVILVRFYNDLDTGRLYAKPLSIIREDAIVRLIY